MRSWIAILLLLLIACAAAYGWQALALDPGHVLVRFGGISIETSLVFAVIVLLLAWAAASLLWRVLRWPQAAWKAAHPPARPRTPCRGSGRTGRRSLRAGDARARSRRTGDGAARARVARACARGARARRPRRRDGRAGRRRKRCGAGGADPARAVPARTGSRCRCACVAAARDGQIPPCRQPRGTALCQAALQCGDTATALRIARRRLRAIKIYRQRNSPASKHARSRPHWRAPRTAISSIRCGRDLAARSAASRPC